LTIFSLEDNKLIKIYRNLIHLPTIKVLIAKQQYQVMLYFIVAQGLSKFIIQVCAKKKDLGLKLMMRKLGKAMA